MTELNINYKIIDDNYINDQEEVKLNKLNKFINKLKKENINNIDGLKVISLIYELRSIIDGN